MPFVIFMVESGKTFDPDTDFDFDFEGAGADLVDRNGLADVRPGASA